MGEKENPWMRSGQRGAVSGWFKKAQKLRQITAMAMLISILALFIMLFDE